jgi:para-nitrobenzyl esterase
VIDGVFLPMDVGETFAVGKQAAVPLLIGTNSWEEVLTARRNVSLADVVQTGTVDEARAAYPGVDDKTLAGWWFADTTFHAPSRYVAAKMERVRQPAYVYYMTYVAEAARGKMPGVPHGADIPYVFDNLRPNQFGTPTERDQAMAMTMSAYWVQFAKTGDPNGGGRPVWPGYTAGETNVLDLGEPIRVDPANLRERMAFHLARLAKVLEN